MHGNLLQGTIKLPGRLACGAFSQINRALSAPKLIKRTILLLNRNEIATSLYKTQSNTPSLDIAATSSFATDKSTRDEIDDSHTLPTPHEFQLKFIIPHSLSPYIFGHPTDKIPAVSTEHATIHITPPGTATMSDKESMLTISSHHPLHCKYTLYLILKNIENHGMLHCLRKSGQFNSGVYLRMIIPFYCAGKVLGRKGENINAICEKTRSKIFLDIKPWSLPFIPFRCINIISHTVEDLYATIDSILDHLLATQTVKYNKEDSSAATDYNDEVHEKFCLEMQEITSTVIKSIPVPVKKIGALFGPRGEYIKTVQEMLGCKIGVTVMSFDPGMLFEKNAPPPAAAREALYVDMEYNTRNNNSIESMDFDDDGVIPSGHDVENTVDTTTDDNDDAGGHDGLMTILGNDTCTSRASSFEVSPGTSGTATSGANQLPITNARHNMMRRGDQVRVVAVWGTHENVNAVMHIIKVVTKTRHKVFHPFSPPPSSSSSMVSPSGTEYWHSDDDQGDGHRSSLKGHTASTTARKWHGAATPAGKVLSYKKTTLHGDKENKSRHDNSSGSSGGNGGGGGGGKKKETSPPGATHHAGAMPHKSNGCSTFTTSVDESDAVLERKEWEGARGSDGTAELNTGKIISQNE